MDASVKKVAEVLSRLGTQEARQVLQKIAKNDAKLASDIEKQMFSYEKILDLDSKDLQRLHQKIDEKDLVFALKATGAALGSYILSAVSDRRKKMILEQMKHLGKIKRSDAEEAKLRIAATMRQMLEKGEISFDLRVE